MNESHLHVVRSRRCLESDEAAFGPLVHSSCLGGFDFTLLFEESVLTILPAIIACLLLGVRICSLQGRSRKVKRSWLYVAKLTTILLYAVLHFIILAAMAIGSASKTPVSIVGTAVIAVTFLLFLYASHLEHSRSLRPSTILSLYLGLSLVFDVIRVRTLWLSSSSAIIASLLSASVGLKAVILVLEGTSKRPFLKKQYQDTIPEAVSGIYSRSLFLWVNPFLWKGYRGVLSEDTLNVLDADLVSASDPEALIESWNKKAGVIPRLAYIGFSFAQPFLVQRVLDFLSEAQGPNSHTEAYYLIAAYGIVYLGLAISMAISEHKTYRVITMVRGSLSTMIFQKTLRLPHSKISDTAGITHLTGGVEWVSMGLLGLHEFYSSVIEAGLAIWLVFRLLHAAALASAAFVVVCVLAGLPLALATGNAHLPWLDAIEKRISVTSKALAAMRPIRMSGISRPVASGISDLRTEEIRSSRSARLFDVLVVVMSYTSATFAPILGFAIYSLLSQKDNTTALTNSIAFSALTLFSLLETPVITLLRGGEELIAVVKGFQRIQSYLDRDEKPMRQLNAPSDSEYGYAEDKKGCINKRSPIQGHVSIERTFPGKYAILRNVSGLFPEMKLPLLQNLSLEIDEERLTMVTGPIGCGTCEWDELWYNEVLRACALDEDIRDMPEGHYTRVGVQGSRISGGQQMRVSLARALYSKQKVLILDNVISGLDQRTVQHMLHSLFSSDGMLKKNKHTVVLATTFGPLLQHADSVIVLGPQGQLVAQGTYSSISADGLDVQSTNQFASLQEHDALVGEEEEPEPFPLDHTIELERIALQRPRNRDRAVYLFYFRNVGWLLVILYFAFAIAFMVALNFPQIWLEWWTAGNSQHPNARLGYWIGIYAGLGILTLVLLAVLEWIFKMIIAPKTAAKFHRALLDTVFMAKPTFLSSTDVGTTLNRFSEDLGIIDEELSSAFDITVTAMLGCIAEAVLIFTGSSGYVSLVVPFCVMIMYFLQKFYLRTSRVIRLIEIELKAPLQSQLLEVHTGLLTIRAFGWMEHYQERNKVALTASQQPYYLLFCLQRWLNLVLDLLVAAIAILVVSIATTIARNSNTGFLGVALFNIVNFSGSLQQLIAQWTTLETSIGALSRIKSFVEDTPRENINKESENSPDDCSKEGRISFIGVSGNHGQGENNAIEDITLEIQPGERVAVCGRTGSGKSSLVMALMQMLEIRNGTIRIGGVDASQIPQPRIRAELNTITQEPIFLHGSVRLNLDPHARINDDNVLIDALQTVGLWDFINAEGGLDIELSDDSLSHGQRQLFCLARALCHPGRILIMDEPTSSIDDAEMEKRIDIIIEQHFQHHTVICIMHKLHNVMSFDKVAVMEKGRLVEFGSPRSLQAREGLFKQLHASGSSTSGLT
ncbi:Cyclic peptide transporter [Penicillium cinerascens]|uniref:Cyclic peptide transporter n=1 Tax=Penicillium cinerascens TaxID=70096 RepID=A0A9W9JK15_9EURO|nr:Cyclic peptide transporter [Penicillium cinerascens]KAJ5198318.1 Cyclic peptide transporter [Penicillium cinerascens]